MVNEFLCSRATGKFATMVLLKVRANGTAEYVNCGHVSPVLANCTSARRLEASNLVVGLIAAAQYRSETCELRPGERILIFTDGITEAENSEGEQFGDSTLEGRTHLYTLESVFEHVSRFKETWNEVMTGRYSSCIIEGRTLRGRSELARISHRGLRRVAPVSRPAVLRAS